MIKSTVFKDKPKPPTLPIARAGLTFLDTQGDLCLLVGSENAGRLLCVVLVSHRSEAPFVFTGGGEARAGDTLPDTLGIFDRLVDLNIEVSDV